MGSRDWLKLYEMKFGTLIMDRRFIIQVYKTDKRLAKKTDRSNSGKLFEE